MFGVQSRVSSSNSSSPSTTRFPDSAPPSEEGLFEGNAIQRSFQALPCPFEANLPINVWVQISQYLTINDFKNLGGTCKAGELIMRTLIGNFLARCGADINDLYNNVDRLFHHMAQNNQPEGLEFLASWFPTSFNKCREALLQIAISNGSCPLLKFFAGNLGDTFNNYHQRILSIAVPNDHVDVVQFLSERGVWANIDLAIAHHSLKTVTFLFNSMLTPNTAQAERLLEVTAAKGSFSIFEFLAQKLETVLNDHKGYLWPIAIAANQLHIAQTLSNLGALSNNSTLLKAISKRNLGVVTFLAYFMPDLFKAPEVLLEAATANGSISILEFLAKKFEEEFHKLKQNLLFTATAAGQLHIIRFLVEHNADLFQQNTEAESLLDIAVLNGQLDTLKRLAAVMKEQFTEDIEQLLYTATFKGHVHILKFLIGENEEVFNKIKNDLMLNAITHRHMPAIRYLMSQGARQDDDATWTLLHASVSQDQADADADIVELFLKGAVSPNTLHGEHTPLSLAISNKRLDIIQLLGKYDANVYLLHGDVDRKSPLTMAVENNLPEIFNALIESDCFHESSFYKPRSHFYEARPSENFALLALVADRMPDMIHRLITKLGGELAVLHAAVENGNEAAVRIVFNQPYLPSSNEVGELLKLVEEPNPTIAGILQDQLEYALERENESKE